ncbi:MAG: hypothetical protein KDA37_00490 [Planctomycetales bacterium]|nr:hypothetical protein [Planctomycetales bacterium]
MPAVTRRRFFAVALGAAGCAAALPRASCAAPPWTDQRQIGPFVAKSTFSLAPYQDLLNELPMLELELRRVLALRACQSPIQIELTGSKLEHNALLKERFPEAPSRRALYVKQDNTATVFAYKSSELAVDLRHECTHALLHADLAMLPLWLDEGLAEYFELPQAERAFGSPHAKALAWDLRLGTLQSIEELEAKTELKDFGLSDYRAAWAWAHFMLHGPKEAARQLWDYLGTIRRGEPPGVLSERMRGALPNADQMLAVHFRQWARLASRGA